MKYKLKLLMGITMICISLLMSGCQTRDDNESAEVDSGDETIRITDSVGRTVEVPYMPNHIATLYATTGHIVAMLDHGQDIVAVNNGLKRDKLLNRLVPEIENAALTVTGGQINIETLLEKNVDIAFIPEDIYMDERQIQQLEELGLPYVVIDFQSIDEEIEAVSLIGDIVGNREEADLYADFYAEVMELLRDRLGDLSEDEKVRVYHSINEAVATVENNTLPEEWMVYAGGINVSLEGDLEQDGDKYYTSLEQIFLWNPEVIYCNESGVPEYILSNEQWAELDAVKSSRVKQLPIGISRWGHKASIETPLAMLWVANDLYPERFEDLDLFEYYARFYEEMFEFQLSQEMYASMLAGDDMRLTKELEEK